MAPDEIIDPHPARAHPTRVAGTPPRYMTAEERSWGASTHTHPEPHDHRKVAIDLRHLDARPSGASPPRTATAPEPRHRIGWALVLMCLAETIVFVTAVATANYVVGLVAVSAMALCGLLLVAAECIAEARGTDR